MRRVLVFSTAYLPLVGGVEVAIKELTDRMSGFEFDLITARIRKDLPRQETIGRVVVHRIGWGMILDKFLLPVLGLPLALKLHAKYHYALSWAMMASQASVLAVLFTKLAHVKLLTTLQEGDEEEHLQRYALGSGVLFKLLIRPWHRLAIKKPDALQVISTYLEDRALKTGATAPITIIPNGVSIEPFVRKIPQNEQEVCRGELGIEKNDRVLIHAGRLAYKNGLDILIRSLVHLPENMDVKLLLIGPGPEEQKLKSITCELELDEQVIFTGRYDNADLPEYLSIADIFIRPSRSEGQGISFIEAMAAGVPVIATPVGGIVDFIKNRETGLFCEVDNPRDLAEKIQTVLSDGTLRKRLIENGIILVKEKYDWDNLAQRMSILFKELIDEKQ